MYVALKLPLVRIQSSLHITIIPLESTTYSRNKPFLHVGSCTAEII